MENFVNLIKSFLSFFTGVVIIILIAALYGYASSGNIALGRFKNCNDPFSIIILLGMVLTASAFLFTFYYVFIVFYSWIILRALEDIKRLKWYSYLTAGIFTVILYIGSLTLIMKFYEPKELYGWGDLQLLGSPAIAGIIILHLKKLFMSFPFLSEEKESLCQNKTKDTNNSQ